MAKLLCPDVELGDAASRTHAPSVPALTQAALRAACERLVAITQAPPEKDYCHPFGFGAAALSPGSRKPAHRCLSQAEARAKLCAIERVTEQPFDALLAAGGWERLAPAQLLAVENVVRLTETGECTQPLGDQAAAWCRLDEALFRLAFSAWITGANFAPAPRPRALARQIGVDLADYRGAVRALRAALARPAAPSPRWPPRVDLWLGDPPVDEAGPPMPRLWASARALRLITVDAAKTGLLPANTLMQERQARQELGRRWSLREDEADPTSSEEASMQYTICCRCSQTLAV